MHPNEKLIREGLEAWAEGSLDPVLSMLTDDIVMRVPGRNPLAGTYIGRRAFADYLQKQAVALGGPPNLDIHDVLANDEHAVWMLRLFGTRGGLPYCLNSVCLCHLRDGKICAMWINYEDVHAMDELLA